MSYELLFEPVKIGPVTAPNRFYQVPHCNALGHAHPQAEATMRGIKAEGGWGVVCTQEVEIHPSAELSPANEGRIWDDRDIPAHQLITEAVHKHGSLAGIELAYNGHHATNHFSRVAPLSIDAMPVHSYAPLHSRAVNKRDIRDLRQWHVDAAKRSKRAGYDIVYVYAGHNMSILMHSMLTRYNKRTDEYGGSLANRVRMTKEILEAVKDAVGDTCAIAFRLAVDELRGNEGMTMDGEAHDVVSMLAELPDLWDVNVSGWDNDSATFRFEPHEGYQEKYTSFVKQLTTKPVVGVGRFTSADVMVSQVKRGVLDLIGAARPSIADPFLPNKIKAGAIESIRECIGCNICVASDNVTSPIRCTQNPTMGEEWKNDWHPEKASPAVFGSGKEAPQTLVVGSGPAGLECALQLSQRGYPVMLAEAASEFGGRALRESTLPGMSSYIRVRDYRLLQLNQSPMVQLLPENALSKADIVDTEIEHVFIATGSQWKRDGSGRCSRAGIDGISSHPDLLTPDDILSGTEPGQRVVVYDDDHYYMGGVIAEKLQREGREVTLMTPDTMVSNWTENTLEQHKIQAQLLNLGVKIITTHELASVHGDICSCACIYTGKTIDVACDSLVLVTSREPTPVDFLPTEEIEEDQGSNSFKTFLAIGDCLAPSTIAAAVYAGHFAAREFDKGLAPYEKLYRREMISLVN